MPAPRRLLPVLFLEAANLTSGLGNAVVSTILVAEVPIVSMTIGLTYGSIFALAIIGAIFDPAGYSARRALIPDAAQASGIDTDRLNGIH